ncbi:rho-N domain-containing protein 1, chloroplastic [Mercurialis annua]|uniref:rho-N domain-containing protein 1, chloroplastic n=1 Tax=Mercurialis annua TaxID=3986 RepID=UPI0021601816|nr:rho-N domain-containing protein 1, chloroplastic [Mercurialis annua]
MSQAVHLFSTTIPGYGRSEGNCLPSSGSSGKVVAVSLCPSRGNRRNSSHVKIGSIKCVSGGASFVCRASSGSPRRNSDFSRQSRQGYSRNRNRQNEERDSFDSIDESDVLTSKNGPLLSFSNTSKFQATATPGPREKEIVELFRKVQAQLRERAAVKENKKVETSKGKVKESETVDSLLKLLRKHSVEQGKKKDSSSGDFAVHQPEQNGSHGEDRNTSFFKPEPNGSHGEDRNTSFFKPEQNGSHGEDRNTSFFKPEQNGSHGEDTIISVFKPNNKERSGVSEPNSINSRPPSSFRRRSPVPRLKFQPVYSNEDSINSTSYSSLTGDKKKQLESLPDTAQLSELEIEEPELELEQELESSFHNGDVLDELSEGESSDIDSIDEDSRQEKENEHELENLSSLKLPELRALAKSRGLKGFSKMKKGELVDLLSGGSI